MTGNPQLTERQETLLRQAEKCRELASRLRAWRGDYDQNCPNNCVLPHLVSMQIRGNYERILGLVDSTWLLTGYTKDYESTIVSRNNRYRCAHDSTPTGAAAWLEQHALTLEAQV